MRSTRLTNDRTWTARGRAREPGRLKAGALMSLASTTVACLLAACTSSSSGSHNATAAGRQSSGGAIATATSSSTAANGATPVGGPVDACSLVTSAEARAFLGKPVKPPKGKALGVGAVRGSSCVFQSTDFADRTAAGLALTISFFPHSTLSRSQFDKTYGDGGAKAVPGLGESAWFLGGILNVYDHGANLSVSIVSLRAEATLGQLEPVARLALGRV
ncbi:MAG: hypothetical protein ABR604_05535 [Jatrophihabitantaceae bacterium]